MAYEICKKCQRFFEKDGKHYCEKCDNELNESREKIENYLENHPRASIMELVNDAGVKLKDVNIFLDSGGAVSFNNSVNTVNLRQEEINEETSKFEKRESLKMKNKFKPRRLRR